MNCERSFYDDVKKIAYELYIERGMEPHRDIDDWLCAETLAANMYAGKTNSRPLKGKPNNTNTKRKHQVS